MRTEILEVPVRQIVEVPSELTEPCKLPSFQDNNAITYGDVVTYLVGALGAVENCNKKLGAIAELNK